MAWVPAQVHAQLPLLRRSELGGAELQRQVLRALLGLDILLVARRLRPEGPPAAVRHDAVGAERLAAVVQSHGDVHGVGEMRGEVRDGVHGVDGCLVLHLGRRRGLAGLGLLWARNLPDHHVAGPELLILDLALDVPRLDVALAELLPALPGGALCLVYRRGCCNLLAGNVWLQPRLDPAIAHHADQRLRVWRVVATQGDDPSVLRAEILDDQQGYLFIVPARKLVHLRVLLGWSPLQRVHIVAPRSNTQHHQIGVARVKVRGAELRYVRSERAVQRHERETDLAGVVAVVQREERDVRARHFEQSLHLHSNIHDHLVPSHLQALFMRDLRMVPEARHSAQISLED
mmetsp:Transcript_82722/g.234350  ORF Transcript_82722/g.234350 Transcript_82722/m.234350 type:complete len:346 (-) Transcript_82722:1746-2783(-)